MLSRRTGCALVAAAALAIVPAGHAIADLGSPPDVVVANAFSSPDLAAAAVIAAKCNAELVTVNRFDIPTEMAGVIQRLEPRSIWVVGGEAVVSTEVETHLGQLARGVPPSVPEELADDSFGEPAEVERLSGANRFATMASIADTTVCDK